MAPAAQGQRNRSGVFRCSGITKVKDLASSYLVGLQVSDTCVIRVSAPLESKGPTPSTLYDLEFDRLNMVMGSQYILDPTLQESARVAPRRGLLHSREFLHDVSPGTAALSGSNSLLVHQLNSKNDAMAERSKALR